MVYKFSFEKLEIWHLSKKLAVEIYSITNQFPNDEKFGLTSHIRRSAISVSSNIAEGSSRISKKESAKFIRYSYGSLSELLCQLMIANDLRFLSNENMNSLRSRIEELSNKINAYCNYLLK